MHDQNKSLEEILERILADNGLPDVDKELLRKLVAYLQQQLRAGRTMRDVVDILAEIAREMRKGRNDDSGTGSGTEREQTASDSESLQSLKVSFQATMEIPDAAREAIAKNLYKCALALVSANSEKGPQS